MNVQERNDNSVPGWSTIGRLDVQSRQLRPQRQLRLPQWPSPLMRTAGKKAWLNFERLEEEKCSIRSRLSLDWTISQLLSVGNANSSKGCTVQFSVQLRNYRLQLVTQAPPPTVFSILYCENKINSFRIEWNQIFFKYFLFSGNQY